MLPICSFKENSFEFNLNNRDLIHFTGKVVSGSADDDLVHGILSDGTGRESQVSVTFGHDTEPHLQFAIGSRVDVEETGVLVARRRLRLASFKVGLVNFCYKSLIVLS